MRNIIQNIKKITLFLFGVILIIWGYKVNAANNTAKAEEEKDKATKEVEILPVAATEKEEDKPQTEQPAEPQAKEVKKETPVKPKAVSTVPAVKKEVEKKIEEEPKKVEEPKQTIIEKATPEEASGTE
ncbi:hypothetical protein [Dysgonomonas gadei]|uniref:Uncharacterized protein n=1 Tax=Dysgonomonas gadei ATCC BAA-286 TaxID=742766 RepID=F5IW34_9BACT|nr:hypothetical protein [Dysgonomonas gadei]EGK02834.1 hypothetical protein HMPREF9455_01084 [Dysgonomonas gadei ATCC BAA-286]